MLFTAFCDYGIGRWEDIQGTQRGQLLTQCH